MITNPPRARSIAREGSSQTGLKRSMGEAAAATTVGRTIAEVMVGGCVETAPYRQVAGVTNFDQ
jgi:hypothetical protein